LGRLVWFWIAQVIRLLCLAVPRNHTASPQTETSAFRSCKECLEGICEATSTSFSGNSRSIVGVAQTGGWCMEQVPHGAVLSRAQRRCGIRLNSRKSSAMHMAKLLSTREAERQTGDFGARLGGLANRFLTASKIRETQCCSIASRTVYASLSPTASSVSKCGADSSLCTIEVSIFLNPACRRNRVTSTSVKPSHKSA